MEKFTQLPNQMDICGLRPKDQLVYVVLRSYMNKDTMEAFPSLQTLSKRINCSIPTVNASIKRLEEKEYIAIRKEGRKNIYTFNKLVKFEPFSKEFLDSEKISFEVKAYLTASQQYMFKDIPGYGTLSLSNRQLADNLNISEKSVRRYNQELKNNNYLTILKNKSRDIESGCKTETKVFDLNTLGQAVIWAIGNHEERISQNTEDIEWIKEELIRLTKENECQKKLISKLMDEQKDEPFSVTL